MLIIGRANYTGSQNNGYHFRVQVERTRSFCVYSDCHVYTYKFEMYGAAKCFVYKKYEEFIVNQRTLFAANALCFGENRGEYPA